MARGKHTQPMPLGKRIALATAFCVLLGLFALSGWVIWGGNLPFMADGTDNEPAEFADMPVLHITPLPAPTPSPSPILTTLPSTPEPSPTPRGIQTVHIRAVGDLMVHEKQLEGALDGENYDFSGCFDSITPVLGKADLVIGNLETTIAYEEFSGYPLFRTPPSYIDALSQAGFSVLTLANNHMWDGKMAGVETTLETLAQYGIASTGAYANKEDAQKILICQVQDVNVAVIAHTSKRNRSISPDWAVDYTGDLGPVVDKIKRSKELGADIVLVMIHWGSEGVTDVGSSQIKAAKTLAEAGADVILGAHPHVLQPAQWLTVQDELGQEHRAFVAYSMGNFLSNQRYNDPPHDAGVIFDVALEKDLDQGICRVSEVSCIPTWVRRNTVKGQYIYDVVPVEKSIAEGVGFTDSEMRRLNRIWKFSAEVLTGVPTIYE